MSAPDPKLNTTVSFKPVEVYSPSTFVDTNALLRKAIQKLPSHVRNEIILRCEELARLQISEEALENAFSQLIQMIIEKKEADAKLFLYITCSSENKQERETISLSPSRYLIQFHTNLTPHAAWMQEAESRINSIASLLLPHSGSLQVNQLKNSGCVFCITLPGK